MVTEKTGVTAAQGARLQLALNVADLPAAIDYYSKLCGVPAAKLKPGYANFEVLEPPLKLVLFESAGTTDRLNHLGVEMFDDAAVAHTAIGFKCRPNRETPGPA